MGEQKTTFMRDAFRKGFMRFLVWDEDVLIALNWYLPNPCDCEMKTYSQYVYRNCTHFTEVKTQEQYLGQKDMPSSPSWEELKKMKRASNKPLHLPFLLLLKAHKEGLAIRTVEFSLQRVESQSMLIESSPSFLKPLSKNLRTEYFMHASINQATSRLKQRAE
jgi:hypothetical protein